MVRTNSSSGRDADGRRPEVQDGLQTSGVAGSSLPPSDVCRQARIARDDRFDGRFYFAVRTTGIFCRPVCPARTALERNVEYFASAPAALAAGYRPCLRCRPEFGPRATAQGGDLGRALEQIEDGALDDDGSVADLAASLDLGERRLRRMFERELGTSPVRVAQMRRLLMARQLLESSRTPIIDVGYASGFASLRRFNEAFRDAFGVTPTDFRESAGGSKMRPRASRSDALVLRLGVRTPYDAAFLMSYLRARAIGGVERVFDADADRESTGSDVSALVYERTFSSGTAAGRLRVTYEATPETRTRATLAEHAGAGATLRVGLTFADRTHRLPNLVDLVGRLRRLFAIQEDPDAMACLQDDPVIGPLTHRFPGTRIPGCFDPFEVGVRVILGQQVTVAGASTLAGRLAREWGRSIEEEATDGDQGLNRLFPGPSDLAAAELERIGLPRTRAETIRAFARRLVEDPGLFDQAEDPQAVRRRLLDLPGVGDWTATLVTMRALRWRDGFPAGDLVLRKRYAQITKSEMPTVRELRSIALAWRPERALAAGLLWRAY